MTPAWFSKSDRHGPHRGVAVRDLHGPDVGLDLHRPDRLRSCPGSLSRQTTARIPTAWPLHWHAASPHLRWTL